MNDIEKIQDIISQNLVEKFHGSKISSDETLRGRYGIATIQNIKEFVEDLLRDLLNEEEPLPTSIDVRLEGHTVATIKIGITIP